MGGGKGRGCAHHEEKQGYQRWTTLHDGFQKRISQLGSSSCNGTNEKGISDGLCVGIRMFCEIDGFVLPMNGRMCGRHFGDSLQDGAFASNRVSGRAIDVRLTVAIQRLSCLHTTDFLYLARFHLMAHSLSSKIDRYLLTVCSYQALLYQMDSPSQDFQIFQGIPLPFPCPCPPTVPLRIGIIMPIDPDVLQQMDQVEPQEWGDASSYETLQEYHQYKTLSIPHSLLVSSPQQQHLSSVPAVV